MDAKLVCLLCIIVINKWGKINKHRTEAEICEAHKKLSKSPQRVSEPLAETGFVM